MSYCNLKLLDCYLDTKPLSEESEIVSDLNEIMHMDVDDIEFSHVEEVMKIEQSCNLLDFCDNPTFVQTYDPVITTAFLKERLDDKSKSQKNKSETLTLSQQNIDQQKQNSSPAATLCSDKIITQAEIKTINILFNPVLLNDVNLKDHKPKKRLKSSKPKTASKSKDKLCIKDLVAQIKLQNLHDLQTLFEEIYGSLNQNRVQAIQSCSQQQAQHIYSCLHRITSHASKVKIKDAILRRDYNILFHTGSINTPIFVMEAILFLPELKFLQNCVERMIIDSKPPLVALGNVAYIALNDKLFYISAKCFKQDYCFQDQYWLPELVLNGVDKLDDCLSVYLNNRYLSPTLNQLQERDIIKKGLYFLGCCTDKLDIKFQQSNLTYKINFLWSKLYTYLITELQVIKDIKKINISILTSHILLKFIMLYTRTVSLKLKFNYIKDLDIISQLLYPEHIFYFRAYRAPHFKHMINILLTHVLNDNTFTLCGSLRFGNSISIFKNLAAFNNNYIAYVQNQDANKEKIVLDHLISFAFALQKIGVMSNFFFFSISKYQLLSSFQHDKANLYDALSIFKDKYPGLNILYVYITNLRSMDKK